MSTEWQSSRSKSDKHILRVSKYEIGATLGEGTFGKYVFILLRSIHFFIPRVRQVRNIYTGQNFAMKILDKQKIIEHRMVDQLSLEVRHFFFLWFFKCSFRRFPL